MIKLHHGLKAALLAERIEQLTMVEESAMSALSLHASECHGNAARWVAAYPGWSVVPGWIVQGSMAPGCAILAKHSVVRDPAGRLLDVTPRLSAQQLLAFIRHDTVSMGPFDEAPTQANVL